MPENKGVCKTCAEICHGSHELISLDKVKDSICECGQNYTKDPKQRNKRFVVCMSMTPFVYDTDCCTDSIKKEKQIQDWYKCVTCDIGHTDESGLCWVCSRVCHDDHKVELKDLSKAGTRCACKQREQEGQILCLCDKPKHYRINEVLKHLARTKEARQEVYSVRCPALLALDK